MMSFDYALMFFSSFVVVFLLGIQSRNVNASRYVSAMITSLGISASQFIFVKYVIEGSWGVFVTTALGGCIGVVFSIWFYSKFMEKRNDDKHK